MEVPAVRAAVLYLAAGALAVAEDDRSAAAPGAPAGLAQDASLADGFVPDAPAALADLAQNEESAQPLAFDRCDSVPASGSTPDGYSDTAALPGDCSAARSLDVRSAQAARTPGSAVDSSQADYYLALPADCSVPAAVDSSAQQTTADHFVPAARSNGSAAADLSPDDCSETVVAHADCWAAPTVDDHSVLAVRTDDSFPADDCSRLADCSQADDLVVRSVADCLDAAAMLADWQGARSRTAAVFPVDFQAGSPEDFPRGSLLESVLQAVPEVPASPAPLPHSLAAFSAIVVAVSELPAAAQASARAQKMPEPAAAECSSQ